MDKSTQEESTKKRIGKLLGLSGKGAFWTWIAYQCIKGTTTTVFIWAPLIYLWWTHH